MTEQQDPGVQQRLHDYLDRWATLRPDMAAAIGPRRLSYAQLKQAVDECAQAMVASGVQRGDRVAMLGVPGTDFLISFLAAASIGAIWVGLNPRYADVELDTIVARIEPRLVLAVAAIEGRCYRKWLERLAPCVLAVVLDAGAVAAGRLPADVATLAKGQEPVPGGGLADGLATIGYGEFMARAAGVTPQQLQHRRQQTDPADPCLIVFTSGSTGVPKGAMISHAALGGASEVQLRVWPAEPLRVLNNLPINHIGCVGDLTCYALIGGGTVVFSPRFDPADSLALMRREHITVWGQVPTMFQLTLDAPTFDASALEDLQLIFWGGAHASTQLVQRLHRLCPRLATSYGQTETVGSITFTPAEATIEMLSSTVGRAVPPYEVRIAGTTQPASEGGEVEVRTPFGMSGYWRDPQASAQAVTEDGWRRTGDVGTLSDAGNLRLLGRVHDVFKSGGYNIYPPEIEAALQAHPEVRQASVVGAPDSLFGMVVVAFVATDSPPPSEEVLREYLRAHLANYKVPKRILFVDELPRLPVGKIDKHALRQRAGRR